MTICEEYIDFEDWGDYTRLIVLSPSIIPKRTEGRIGAALLGSFIRAA